MTAGWSCVGWGGGRIIIAGSGSADLTDGRLRGEVPTNSPFDGMMDAFGEWDASILRV